MAIERRAVALVALAAAASPAAADTMRCGSRLVSDGDAMEQVLESCGEPAERTRTWIQRQPRFEYGGREIPFEGREDVPVDVWTYDFGSSKLKRRVRFVAGRVQSIETLEHGSNR